MGQRAIPASARFYYAKKATSSPGVQHSSCVAVGVISCVPQELVLQQSPRHGCSAWSPAPRGAALLQGVTQPGKGVTKPGGDGGSRCSLALPRHQLRNLICAWGCSGEEDCRSRGSTFGLPRRGLPLHPHPQDLKGFSCPEGTRTHLEQPQVNKVQLQRPSPDHAVWVSGATRWDGERAGPEEIACK